RRRVREPPRSDENATHIHFKEDSGDGIRSLRRIPRSGTRFRQLRKRGINAKDAILTALPGRRTVPDAGDQRAPRRPTVDAGAELGGRLERTLTESRNACSTRSSPRPLRNSIRPWGQTGWARSTAPI